MSKSIITIADLTAWGSCYTQQGNTSQLLAWYPTGEVEARDLAVDSRISLSERRWAISRALAHRDRKSLVAWANDSAAIAKLAGGHAAYAYASASAASASAYASADAASYASDAAYDAYDDAYDAARSKRYELVMTERLLAGAMYLEDL